MTKQSKKSTRGTTLDKKATKAAPTQSTEKSKAAPKTAAGKYGAPAVRPNRADKVKKSVRGDRKWIFRGITEVDPTTLKFKAHDATEKRVFDKATAEKVLAKALEHPDVVNGRLFYAKPTDKGVEQRSVWIALKEDNGDYRTKAA